MKIKRKRMIGLIKKKVIMFIYIREIKRMMRKKIQRYTKEKNKEEKNGRIRRVNKVVYFFILGRGKKERIKREGR